MGCYQLHLQVESKPGRRNPQHVFNADSMPRSRQMKNSSLGKAFSQGVVWFYLLKINSRLIATVQIVIVARFLAPSEFGVMGIATLLLSFLGMLATIGYEQALIQKKESINEYLDTVWIVSIGRGLLLGAILYLSAPLAAVFFDEPQALRIIRVVALVPVLKGFASPGLIKLKKDLHFRTLALFEGVQSMSGAIVAIASAVILHSVWALVIVYVYKALLFVVGSFFVYPFQPKLRFDWKKVRELWSFGRWILGSKLLHYLFNDGDDWVVGGLLGSQALGFYQMAYRLGNAPMTEVTGVFSQVAFPTYAKMQGDVERSRLAYLRVLQVIMFVSTPVAAGIFLVAYDAINIALGEAWLPIVATLRILVLWGWVRAFRATTGPMLLAHGHPELITRFTFIKVVLLATLIVPVSVRWGIVGTSWAVVIAAVLETPLLLRSVTSVLQVEYASVLQRILRPLIPVLPMIIVVLYWQHLIFEQGNGIVRLVASTILGASVYISLTLFLDKVFSWGLLKDLRVATESSVQPVFRKLTNRFSRKTT